MKLEKKIKLEVKVMTNAEMTEEEFEGRIKTGIIEAEMFLNKGVLRWHISEGKNGRNI